MRGLKDKVALVAGAGHRRQVSPGRVMREPLRIPSALLGSVLLGAASGLRAQIGLAILVARQDPSLPPFLQRPWTRRLLVAGAAGELVIDKLPSIPSRLVPPGIASRLALGALAASLLARTRRAPWLPAAVVGASSAAVAAKLGHDARARLARTAPDPAVAVIEDALAVGLAAIGYVTLTGAPGGLGVAQRRWHQARNVASRSLLGPIGGAAR